MKIEPATCPVCRRQYDPLRARAIAVLDGRVRAFCSIECKERGDHPSADPSIEAGPAEAATRRAPRGWAWAGGAALLGLGGLGIVRLLPPSQALPPPAVVIVRAPPVPAAPAPTAQATAETMKLLQPKAKTTDRDAWIHPLYGPRRLPIRNTRRFGAARQGLRPDECRSGHCGVDLGDRAGDRVLATHDGVVERAVRSDDGKEGRFLRVNHKGGTVVTSYMHLDQVRPDLKPGVPVKAGEELGTIGATGVHHSGPHLHFAVSVRASVDDPELFIDPEPLLHLWAVKDPPSGLETGPRKRRTARARSAARPKDSPPQGT